MEIDRRTALAGMAALGGAVMVPRLSAQAAEAPAVIKIGQLYASTGPVASTSMPVYYGVRLWIDEENAKGGAYVKAFNKRIPIKLIAYDDQSSTATAATLINRLITQDHVDLLISDCGSVLTSVAVPIAREYKQFLFNPTGTGAPFFTNPDPEIALLADPASTIWPKYAAEFLNNEGPKLGIKTVAIIYCTNDFTGTQAIAFRKFINDAGKLKIVYDQGVPTSTSNYTVLINNIAAQNPDAVIQLGQTSNDIAFLRDLRDLGQKFKFLFTVFAGVEPEAMLKAVGVDGLEGVFTYVTGAEYEYKVTTGMNLPQYRAAWKKKYAHTPGTAFGMNAISGYTVGIVMQEALANATGLDQPALKEAVFGLSGKLTSLSGPFELDKFGAQIGEITPLGQVAADGKGGIKFNVMYPDQYKTGNAEISTFGNKK